MKAKNRLTDGGTNPFDFLVVNRLSHGGRGILAGPQGGYEQAGKHGITSRWNADSLIETLNETSELIASVTDECTNLDFSKVKAETIYFDPPYYNAGPQLYPLAFTHEDHERLAKHLAKTKNWVLSYDDHSWVREAYSSFDIRATHTNGNGGKKSELVIRSKRV